MTETLARQETMTAEQFWTYCAGRDGRVELVDGRIVEMSPVSPTHGDIDTRFVELLSAFVRKNRLGKVYLNTGFVLRRNPDLVRGPDQAFVRTERIAENPPPERGYWEIAPDLVLEIVSPDDTASEVQEKVQDYLEAGVRLVWVLYPPRRQVYVHRPGAFIEVVGTEGSLDGGDVVPGFRLPLAELWEEP